MTIETFVTMLWEQQVREEGHIPSFPGGCSLLEYGHEKGWLEDMDVRGRDSQLNRQTAARILHMFLRLVRLEADEREWNGAEQIRDLYDCHTCVGHVAQIYAKGILPCREDRIFGMGSLLTAEEAKEAVGRVFYPALRLKTEEEKVENVPAGKALKLTAAEALSKVAGSVNPLLIDVRPARTYEEDHLNGAVNIPMAQILDHPKEISGDLWQELFLYCEKGYQSRIAANCLADHGYTNVWWFGTEEDGCM